MAKMQAEEEVGDNTTQQMLLNILTLDSPFLNVSNFIKKGVVKASHNGMKSSILDRIRPIIISPTETLKEKHIHLRGRPL